MAKTRLRDPETKDQSQAKTVRLGINQLEPDIRSLCLDLADGDAHRIEVHDARHAVVR